VVGGLRAFLFESLGVICNPEPTTTGRQLPNSTFSLAHNTTSSIWAQPSVRGSCRRFRVSMVCICEEGECTEPPSSSSQQLQVSKAFNVSMQEMIQRIPLIYSVVRRVACSHEVNDYCLLALLLQPCAFNPCRQPSYSLVQVTCKGNGLPSTAWDHPTSRHRCRLESSSIEISSRNLAYFASLRFSVNHPGEQPEICHASIECSLVTLHSSSVSRSIVRNPLCGVNA
jgi:hypothetical protein